MEIVRMMLSAPSERQEIGKFTMSTSARHFCFVVIFSKNVTWITLRAKMRVNSSVKLQTCVRGSIVAGRAPFSRAKFQRKRKLGKGKLEASNTKLTQVRVSCRFTTMFCVSSKTLYAIETS